MRKVLVLFSSLIICFLITSRVIAQDFLPRYSDSIKHYGMGVYFTPKDAVIYSNPDKEDIIESIKWDNLGVESFYDDLSSKNLFVAFVPDKNIALMSVTDETDEAYEVVYDQKTGKKGWIKKTKSGKFLTWLEFMKKYGREKGIYFFSDLPEDFKQIYTGPDETSQLVKDCRSYSPDDVKLQFIRGNWMLVKVVDYSRTNTYIGWIRWRNDEGKIFAFPNLRNNY